MCVYVCICVCMCVTGLLPRGSSYDVLRTGRMDWSLKVRCLECVLLLENVFSYYRMCSLTVECASHWSHGLAS